MAPGGCFIWTTPFLKERQTLGRPLDSHGHHVEPPLGYGSSLGCLTRPIMLGTGPEALGKSPNLSKPVPTFYKRRAVYGHLVLSPPLMLHT